ncbi:MAG: glutathione S-transferase family protein [Rhizobiaceae bacterium]
MTESGAPDLILYHSPTSVCSAKVRLLLAELELDWQGRKLDLAKGDQFQPDYLAINANGVVPTLIDDGRVVTESNDIMRHLVHRYGRGSAKRISENDEGWLSQSLALHDAVNTFTQVIVNRARLRALPAEELEQRIALVPDPNRAAKMRCILEEGFEAAAVSRARDCVSRLVGEIDLETGSHRWLGGDRYTVADMAILPHINRLELLGLEQFWRAKKNLLAWLLAARDRPSFNKAVGSLISAKAITKYATAISDAKADIEALFAD